MSASAVRPSRPAPSAPTASTAPSASNDDLGAESVDPRNAARALSGFQWKSSGPAAGQRARKELRAGIAGARRAQDSASVDVGRARGHPSHHRRTGNPHRRARRVGDAAQSPSRSGQLASRRRRARGPGGESCAARGKGLGELGVGRSRRRLPQGGRAAGDDVESRRSTPRRCSASRRRRSRRRSMPRAS